MTLVKIIYNARISICIFEPDIQLTVIDQWTVIYHLLVFVSSQKKVVFNNRTDMTLASPSTGSTTGVENMQIRQMACLAEGADKVYDRLGKFA